MRQWVYDCWNGVMNSERNPLRHIPDLQTRHLIMQCLAWTWCGAFSTMIGSYTLFGLSAFIHCVLLAVIVLTVATFETAKRKPGFFLKKDYHTPSRARTLYVDGKKIEDPYGGEHE